MLSKYISRNVRHQQQHLASQHKMMIMTLMRFCVSVLLFSVSFRPMASLRIASYPLGYIILSSYARALRIFLLFASSACIALSLFRSFTSSDHLRYCSSGRYGIHIFFFLWCRAYFLLPRFPFHSLAVPRRPYFVSHF